MRKVAVFLALLMFAPAAQAAITVGTAPASLVTLATTLAASSSKAVFEFALTADAGETLSSVAVTVNSSTAVSGDLASVKVYKDDGDGSFDASDSEAGSNSTVNIGSTTTINTASNNTLTGAKFFVVLNTAVGWSGADSVTVTFNANGITASANSPTNSAVTTAALAADLTGPALQAAVAHNKVGGTNATEAGDFVVLTFNEATNKPAITAANINSILTLNNSHTWLDGVASIGGAGWNGAGTELTITLSAGGSIPTVAIADTVTIAGSTIKDASDNNATGSIAITGSFGITSNGDDDDDDEDENEKFGRVCTDGIINGRPYKVSGSETVYLAAACRLKPFRGAAVFHARGHKFQNIVTLSSLDGLTVSDHPAVPAAGTLVKGSDKTVWFVTNKGKKKGFTSENAFKRMGFNFKSVKQISDSDLATMLTQAAIAETDDLPNGMIAKCSNSAVVFEVNGNVKLMFTNPDVFLNRGHSWDVIAVIDCGKFTLAQGSTINQ